YCVGGELAELADGHEARAQLVGDGRAEDEDSAFDADDFVHIEVAELCDHLVNHFAEGFSNLEEGSYVAEKDSGDGEVGNVADQVSQGLVHGYLGDQGSGNKESGVSSLD